MVEVVHLISRPQSLRSRWKKGGRDLRKMEKQGRIGWSWERTFGNITLASCACEVMDPLPGGA